MKPSLPSLHTQLIALRARNSLDRGNDCLPCCERFVQTCFPWTLNAAALNTLIEVNELQRKNSSHGNEVLRKILCISYKNHVTNDEVPAKIQQAIGPHEDLTIEKRRKLKWYGRVSRLSGLTTTILQGTVKVGRKQGRQRKRWEDNRERTGLEFSRSQRAVENREKGEN